MIKHVTLDENVITNGFCPLSSGWSKAGCWWDIIQSIKSPSGLCNKSKQIPIHVPEIQPLSVRFVKKKYLKVKKNALIVLTGSLLIFFKWALILFNLCNATSGLKVWLALEWDCTCDEVEFETMGCDKIGLIEVKNRSKVTKRCRIGDRVFREVEEDNLREWFSEVVVCSETTWFSCLHWCCLLVSWNEKNESFIYLFVQETE